MLYKQSRPIIFHNSFACFSHIQALIEGFVKECDDRLTMKVQCRQENIKAAGTTQVSKIFHVFHN